jgi:hypothetical protein
MEKIIKEKPLHWYLSQNGFWKIIKQLNVHHSSYIDKYITELTVKEFLELIEDKEINKEVTLETKAFFERLK